MALYGTKDLTIKPKRVAKPKAPAKPRGRPKKASNGTYIQKGVAGSVENPRKKEILEDAKQGLMNGDTIPQIAERNGISKATLSIWFAQLGDEYTQLRNVWIDRKLEDAQNAIETSSEQLEVARARELWKSATWYAERRDRRYMSQQQVTTVTLDLSAAIQAGRDRAGLVVDGECSTVDDQ